jgi:transcriptional regulator with XRE-family HTH domain
MSKPLEYGPQPGYQANVPLSTHGAIAEILKQKIQAIPIKELARQTGVDRNAIRRVLRGERVHSKTRTKLLKAVSKLDDG